MKRNSVYFTIAVILIVSAMVLAYIYPFAKSEPVSGGSATATASSSQTFNVDNSNKNITVNSAEELRKISLLGGTNSELALEENPGLGIAKEFSIFAEEDVTFTGADTEGKVAAGGGVYGQATKRVNGENIPYEYQIGINSSDKYSADVVVGNGSVEGIALNYGYTDDGITQTEDNKIIAYSTKATNMNLDSYSDEEKEHFVEADLIDFDSEFERLRNYSHELASKQETGEVIDGNRSRFVMVGNSKTNYKKIEGPIVSGIVSGADEVQYNETGFIRHVGVAQYILRGSNPECNIFNISGNIYGNIILDVPYNSKVVINQLGDKVTFGLGGGGGIFYPLTEEQLSEIDIDKQRITYLANENYGEDEPADYVRDENNNLKAFIRVGAGSGNPNKNEIEDLSNNILVNIPNATELQIDDTCSTMLAPNADVKTIGNDTFGYHSGYLFGTLICKSFIGKNQIYGKKEQVSRKYQVNVSKIDEDLREGISNAELELYNSEGNVIHTWISSNTSEKIDLDVGTYTIKEKKVPDNYVNDLKEISFRIDSDAGIYNEQNERISSADIVFIKSYREKKYVDHEQKWISENDNYTFRVLENSGINFDEITSKVVDNEYTTSDGGKIVVNSSNTDLIIPASETADNKEIKYEVVSKQYKNSLTTWNVSYRTSIIKYNEDGKVQWVANMQAYGNNGIDMGDVVESDGKIIIFGNVGSSHIIYANETQTVSNREILVNENTIPCRTPCVIELNGDGKIINISQIENQVGQFDKVLCQNDQIYAQLQLENENKVIKLEPITFPYSMKMLYGGLDETVGNISKISFDVDTSTAISRRDDDLFLIVAENNGKFAFDKMGVGNNWTEFVPWTSVSNNKRITTTIPVIEELYPYYNRFDNESDIKLMPHFYRQSAEDNSVAEEVFDIAIKNVTAHWKEVQYITKTREIVVSVENDEPIIIPNKHITTTVKITKIDANSKKKLAGAVFGIYNSENNELLYTSEKTDKNGEIVLSDLALDKGTYYVKEIEAPEGYELSTESKEFVVDGTNSREFIFENVVKSKENQDKSEEEPKEEQKEEQKEETKEEEQKQEQPKKQEPQQVQTGDTIFIALIVLGLAVVGCGATFVLKKYYK